MIAFVSPHFDDAIGSCGCLINSLTSKGEDVQVLTVFAGEHDGKVSEFAKLLLNLWNLSNGVTERNVENIEACNILGANYFNLHFVEALYRKEKDWLYPSDGDLFGPINICDYNLSSEIADEIIRLYNRNTIFYFPSARGKHVDHLIVKAAGEILVSKGYTVRFYTDFSYSGEISNSLKIRKELTYFSTIDFEKKIRAFNAYKSQLKMLFDSDDSRDYFSKENKTKNGDIYEEYYKCI